jgi:hypothetical protein
MEEERSFPTMIIPQGTEITVNDRGQLAIRTPGNLVIQNPGTYSLIECTKGSIRIDAGVKVETVAVQVADTCLVAGNLTAWQLKARRVVLERGSQAFVMLLQAETLEIDKQSRLVGNFGSEQELYLMLSRFNNELRELPQSLTPGDRPVAEIPAMVEPPRTAPQEPAAAASVGAQTQPIPTAPVRSDDRLAQEEADVVALLRVMLQRELLRNGLAPEAREDLSGLLVVLKPGELAGVQQAYLRARGRMALTSPELRGAFERFDRFLAIRRPWSFGP